MRPQTIIKILALFIALGLQLANTDAHAERALVPVRLQLMWKHQFEFAGFYAALEKGFYREAGLDVSIAEFRSDMDLVEEVTRGRADYGVNDASLIIDRYRGQPVVLLSNIFQHSPMVLLSTSESAITTPAQMIGKRVMLANHEIANANILAMLASENVHIDQIKVVPHSFDASDLLNGKADAMSAYATNEPYTIRERGVRFNILDPINYGIDFYGDNLFTSEDKLRSDPDQVRRFVAASLKGWTYALDHPGEIIELILNRYNPGKSRAALEYEANTLRRYILRQHIRLGTIDPMRMKRIVDTYRELGMIDGPFALDEFIHDPFKVNEHPLRLSPDEVAWVHSHSTVRLGVDPLHAPFESLDDDGRFIGISADIMRLVEKRTGLRFVVTASANRVELIDQLRQGHLDALPAVMRSELLDEAVDFTQPYLSFPLVMLSNNDGPALSDLDDLAGKTVVVIDGYAVEDLLRINHPGLIVTTAPDIDAAIDKLTNREVDALVDDVASISHAISRRGLSHLRISGATGYQFAAGLALARNRPMLRGILRKALESIGPDDLATIKQRWIGAQLEHRIDYTLVTQIGLVGLTITLLTLAWNRRLMREVRQRKQAESRALLNEQRFRQLFEDNRAAELIIDPVDGAIVEANHAAAAFYGYERDALRELKITDINTLSESEIAAEMARAREEARSHFYFRHRLASGEVRDVEVHSGPVQWDERTLLYSIIHDVTREKQLQEELAENTKRLGYEATHDALTGLINRAEFETRLKRIIEHCQRRPNRCQATLIYMDLDQFKLVNDSAGHAAGDDVLRKVSQLMRSHVRERDTLARLGGDEFALLLQQCPLEDAVTVGLSILNAVRSTPFVWELRSFHVGISMGIAPIETGVDMDEVLQQADAACYASKAAGPNRYHVFSTENEAPMRRRGEMWWTNEIMRAADEDRFVLFRQDISPVQAHTVGGAGHYEVLLRMIDAEGNLVRPGDFLPAAERYKLMPMIDRRVITLLCDALANCPDLRENTRLCSINLSGQSVGDAEFRSTLFEHLEKSAIAPEKLCFEITETAAIANFNEAQSLISMLKGFGCSFALDDFGSGLSSFSYLKHLDVDYLKIDGEFVRDIVDDTKDRLIVESMHGVGRGLGMQTIAEFVENEQILDALRDIGVDHAQGFAIHVPEPLINPNRIALAQVATTR